MPARQRKMTERFTSFPIDGLKIILSDETLRGDLPPEIFASRCDWAALSAISPLGPSLSRTLGSYGRHSSLLSTWRPRDYRTLLLPRLSEGSRRLDKRRSRQGKVEAIMGSPGLIRKVPRSLKMRLSRWPSRSTRCAGAAPATITPVTYSALHQAISRTFHPERLPDYEVGKLTIKTRGLGRAHVPFHSNS